MDRPLCQSLRPPSISLAPRNPPSDCRSCILRAPPETGGTRKMSSHLCSVAHPRVGSLLTMLLQAYLRRRHASSCTGRWEIQTQFQVQATCSAAARFSGCRMIRPPRIGRDTRVWLRIRLWGGAQRQRNRCRQGLILMHTVLLHRSSAEYSLATRNRKRSERTS